MTEKEKIIVSAHTGVLMADWLKVRGYIEEKIGRPFLTHELARREIWDDIKTATRSDFLALCKENVDAGESITNHVLG